VEDCCCAADAPGFDPLDDVAAVPEGLELLWYETSTACLEIACWCAACRFVRWATSDDLVARRASATIGECDVVANLAGADECPCTCRAAAFRAGCAAVNTWPSAIAATTAASAAPATAEAAILSRLGEAEAVPAFSERRYCRGPRSLHPPTRAVASDPGASGLPSSTSGSIGSRLR
jgi:hypothetical protein